jgi:hypothetical protein
MTRDRIVCGVLVLALAGGCSRARKSGPACPVIDRSNGEIPQLVAAQAAPGAIRIDGVLDEPVWQAAECSGAFVSPGSGEFVPGSRVNAAAWLAWDEANLYVAIRVEDGEPVAAFVPSDVDPHVWERSSGVELMLQPGDPGDNREYDEVQIDTAGAKWTTSFDDYNQPIADGPDGKRFGHQEWEPRIATAATTEPGRYTIEFGLAWEDVKSSRVAVPPHPGDVWRVNLYSFRDGQIDALAWSPILGEGNFHRAARFGRVVFQGR